MEKFAGQVLLITGPRGSGKTTLCKRVVEVARQANWNVCGLISPAIIKGAMKVGIGVEDLHTGKRFLLAKLPSEEKDEKPQTVRWVFDTRCLEWGNTVLKNAVPCDLLVVDELGPLELEQNKGWQAGISALESGKFHLGIGVVREELLNKLLWRWPRSNVVTVKNIQQVDMLLEKIIEKLVDIQSSFDGKF